MDKGLNATAASLLGLLHESPMHGGELFEAAVRRLGGFWSTTRSQVYRELLLLAEAGLVRAQRPGKRKSQPYSITKRGEKAFQVWMSKNAAGDSIRVPAALHVAFANLVDRDELRGRLEAELDHRNAGIRRLQERYDVVMAAGEAIDGCELANILFAVKFERLVGEWIATWLSALDAPGDGTDE